ncbi:MAG: DUF2059 domain-containing protein [Rhodobacteraceae bacterium]|nr:DUF2059 domain-containing protein [Paracoccaceae bacterium]
MFLASLSLLATPTQAADRDRIGAFLNITGFDVALDSIALSAGRAPGMLGVPDDQFGYDWQRLSREVFDTTVMRTLAEDILEATLSDSALSHAAGFYATDLGQRLVTAENASHMDADRTGKQQSGREIVAGWLSDGAPRLEIIKRMNMAVSSAESSVRALQEIQIRFLLAADAAGVIKLRVDAKGLRSLMKQQEGEMRRSVQQSALAGAAFTYQGFTDAEIEQYAVALEQPEMKLVYELLNAVQYEIMANRFEVLATRMAELHPSQDI